MSQVKVSFSLPMNRSGVQRETVSVTGSRCLSVCEAKSDAAAAALQRLASGPFNIQTMDISQIQCEELKKDCEEVLAKAGELHRILVTFLAGWAECTRQIEDTYRLLWHGGDYIAKQIKEEMGRRLLRVSTASNDMLEVVDNKSKAAKAHQCEVRASLRKYFNENFGPKDESDRIEFLCKSKMNLSMRTVLSEMAISLGWVEPDFSKSGA